MWRFLEKQIHEWRRYRYWRSLENALALNRRGEARCDGLVLTKSQNRLEIQWQARDIHPWDRDLPLDRQSLMFVEQALADTEAAVSRLFGALPQVDVIELKVLEPMSGTAIMEGIVHRSTMSESRRLSSVKMRVLELGIEYRLAGSRFEALNSDRERDTIRLAIRAEGEGATSRVV